MKKFLSALCAAFALIACSPADPQPEPAKSVSDPTGLTVELLNNTSVLLTWSHDGEGVEGWYVFLRGENEPEGVQPVNPDSPLGAGERAYIFRGLELGKSYYFGVRPKTAEGGMHTVYSELFAMPAPEPEPEPEPQPVTHKRKAVFIGDSITRLWPETDAAFFNRNGYMGKGRDGETSKTIALRFNNDVVKNDPYVVHIMCGINDVAENDGKYVESSEILANIQKMAEMAEAADIKVVVGSLTPANKFWWWADDWKPSKEGVTIPGHIQEANSLIKAWCEEKGYPFIDYYTPFVGPDGGFPSPWAYDGVHPALDGFLRMDKLVQPVLEELLKDVTI